jgi:hypothetical protein
MSRPTLILSVAAALLTVPTVVTGQQSADGQIAVVVFGYATQREGIRRPGGEQGLGAGTTVGILLSRPDRPRLQLETGLLVVSSIVVPCQTLVPSDMCGPRRELHGVGTLRGALLWPLRWATPEWYAGFGIGGYFPMDQQRILPGLAGGLDLTLGVRELTTSSRLFIETRITYVAGQSLHGGALYLLSGLAF